MANAMLIMQLQETYQCLYSSNAGRNNSLLGGPSHENLTDKAVNIGSNAGELLRLLGVA